MSTSKEIEEDFEFAKHHLMQSNLDDKCKRTLMRLLDISTMATNGISLEEKVQKITEIIQGMVVSQITFLDSIDKRIVQAHDEKCKTCKALKLADEIEEHKKQEEIIEAWKKANGYIDNKNDKSADQLSILDTLKTILIKPYAWIFASILVFSPYGVDIVKAVLNFFSK